MRRRPETVGTVSGIPASTPFVNLPARRPASLANAAPWLPEQHLDIRRAFASHRCMTGVVRSREWPGLDAALFAAALVLYALGVPLGLARVEAAPDVAAGVALDSSQQPAVFAVLAMRLVAFVPLGDLALRANLASAVLGAVSVMLLGRLCVQVLVSLRPPPNARQERQTFLSPWPPRRRSATSSSESRSTPATTGVS